MDTETLWTLDDVAGYLNICRRTAVDLVRRPGFPARVRLTSRCHRWVPSQVRAWVREQQDPPPAPPAPPRKVRL